MLRLATPSDKRCKRCGATLRSDNASGLCFKHRGGEGPHGRAMEKPARLCAVPKCSRRRMRGSQLCVEHKNEWRRSSERRTAELLFRRFLGHAAGLTVANHGQPE